MMLNAHHPDNEAMLESLQLEALNLTQPWLRSELFRVIGNQCHLLEWLLEAYPSQHVHFIASTQHLLSVYQGLHHTFWQSPLDSLALVNDLHFVLATESLPIELKLLQAHCLQYLSTLVHVYHQLNTNHTSYGAIINLHSTLLLLESAMALQETQLVQQYLNKHQTQQGTCLIDLIHQAKGQGVEIQSTN
ncbi:MAG: hypothetical protein ACKO34_02820 [Vampirovibrionales bacterium]